MRSLSLTLLLMIGCRPSGALTTCASQVTDPSATQTITLTASDPAACQLYQISPASYNITFEQAGEITAAILLLLAGAFVFRQLIKQARQG